MPAPSMLDLDILRASLGPSVVPPYENAFGPAPWLTAGTLTWTGGDAAVVLPMWRAWARRLPGTTVTAVRRTEYVVAVDVAFIGEPWGAARQLEPLRALEPLTDTVGLTAPSTLLGRRGGAPAEVVAAVAPKGTLPEMRALAAVPVPEGVALGARYDAIAGPALLAVGIAAEADRLHVALAALDRRLQARVGVE